MKSGRLRALAGLGTGGGDSTAMILPRLLIPTASPSSIQFRTLPKSCRSCLTVAVFMCHKHVILFQECQPGAGKLATLLTLANWNQITGWLQEVNLLREAASAVVAARPATGAQTLGFAFRSQSLPVLESV